MDQTSLGHAHAVANLAAGEILATVEVGVPAERVFHALASPEIKGFTPDVSHALLRSSWVRTVAWSLYG